MMKEKWIALVATLLASLMLVSGIAYADESKGKSETKAAGPIQVEFITPPEGAVVGANQIALHLKDTATGQPVVRDSVRVQLSMDGGDMSHMNHGAVSNQSPLTADLLAARDEPGYYSGKVNFTDAGDWKANVVLDPRNPQGSASFGVHVINKSSGPNWLIIGLFVGIIGAVALVAFVMKSRYSRPNLDTHTTGVPTRP
jgi:hypothetical protein